MDTAKEQRVSPQERGVTGDLHPKGSSGQVSGLQSFSRATQDNAQVPHANSVWSNLSPRQHLSPAPLTH